MVAGAGPATVQAAAPAAVQPGGGLPVLVTGGGGFLGRAIVGQLLAAGYRVRSFARGAYPELESLGVEVVPR